MCFTFATRKRILLPIIITVFFTVTLIWKAFDGRWESRYATNEGSYLMDLDSIPIWDKPSPPSIDDFIEHFSGSFLPSAGEITVYHKWDWWLVDVFMVWLIGSLVIAPISFVAFRRDRFLGVFARVGAGLIASALVCVLLWLVFGGWGPPAPLFFAVIGLVAGGIWGTAYARKAPTNKNR